MAFIQARKLFHAGRYDEAESILLSAIEEQPDQADILNLLGTVRLYHYGPQSDAEECFEKALRLKPDDPHLYNNMGNLRWQQGRFSEAASFFSKAINLNSEFSLAYINLGNSLKELGQLEKAADAYRSVLEIKPGLPRVCHNLALIYSELGNWQESLTYFNRAISLRPDYAQSLYGRGMLYLKQGLFEKGWIGFEWRFEATGYDYFLSQQIDEFQWNGEPFIGRTLLVYHDQGLGDAIHFIRYLPMVKALGGRVIFICAPRLLRLFKNIDGVDEIESRWSDIQHIQFDYHIALLSLPRVFHTTLDSIPCHHSYLSADEDKVQAWQNRIKRQDVLNVGLVWSGKPTQKDNHRRSCKITDYEPLASVPGVNFYSLQKGLAAEQAPLAPEKMQFLDYSEEINDFSDTAALIKNLDLVISVDTSVAHLAGALGQPVWVVLCFNHCWRYMLEREDSPWYPSMRLYRQPRAGDWASVMQELSVDLMEYAKNRKGDHLIPQT